MPLGEVYHNAHATHTRTDYKYLFLTSDFPRERVPVVLAPLLYQNQLDITEERQVMVPQTAPEVSTTS